MSLQRNSGKSSKAYAVMPSNNRDQAKTRTRAYDEEANSGSDEYDDYDDEDDDEEEGRNEKYDSEEDHDVDDDDVSEEGNGMHELYYGHGQNSQHGSSSSSGGRSQQPVVMSSSNNKYNKNIGNLPLCERLRLMEERNAKAAFDSVNNRKSSSGNKKKCHRLDNGGDEVDGSAAAVADTLDRRTQHKNAPACMPSNKPVKR